jgi:multisubunit Na+/H+ antiporter MnhC subunit
MELGPLGFGILPLLFILTTWVIGFVVGLLFIVVAARFATRAVLDEIDKDRRRRGGT